MHARSPQEQHGLDAQQEGPKSSPPAEETEVLRCVLRRVCYAAVGWGGEGSERDRKRTNRLVGSSGSVLDRLHRGGG